MEERPKGEVLKALEALRKASKEVEATAGDEGACESPSMNALLQLETGSEDLLSGDPHLTTLSGLLSHLKSLLLPGDKGDFGAKDGAQRPKGLLSFVLRRKSSGRGEEISRVAGSIGAEIQSWIDREVADRLIAALRPSPPADAAFSDEEKEALLTALESRAACGFDRDFQDVLLRTGAFAAVESALADPAAPRRVRERCAAAVLAMVRFNKDVFVGPVLMGPAVNSLVAVASAASLAALAGLIAAIRSPLVDELHARGLIPRLAVILAGTGDASVLALECVLEMGYYGRKEAVDAMLAENLIKRLMGLQRADRGGALIEIDGRDCAGDDGAKGGFSWTVWGRDRRERRYLASHPFASCVARFAVAVEVGEGLRWREKRAFKADVVARVREAAADDAEAATVLAEVLWGSTNW